MRTTNRACHGVVALVALLCGAVFIPTLASAAQPPQLLVDIENMEVMPFDKKAIDLPKLTEAEKLELHQFNQAKERDLAILRCEAPDSLNQFGKPELQGFGDAFPQNLPEIEAALVQKSVGAPDMFRVRVWRGLLGGLQIDAGYGFLSILQYYQPDQKTALFREIELAGWKDTGTITTGEQNKVFPNMTFRIFEKPEQTGPVVRKLHIIEEQLFVDLKFPRRPGLTLSCISTVKEK